MKILFILNSCLGDVILSTSVIKFIIDKYPSAKIYLIKDYRSGNIFDNFPNINLVYNFSKMRYHLHWIFILFNFLFNYYDIIYDFKNSPVSRILLSKKKFIFKYDKKSINETKLNINQIIKKISIYLNNIILTFILMIFNTKIILI